MAERVIGKVAAIAIKTAEFGPMREVDSAVGVAGGTLEGSQPCSPERGLTLLSSRQWAQVQRELGGQMPWYTRRANLLIEADGLGGLIGRTVRAGELTIEICGESRPCGLMDRLQPGLRQALTRDCRGGVFGRIVCGGRVSVGDALHLVE